MALLEPRKKVCILTCVIKLCLPSGLNIHMVKIVNMVVMRTGVGRDLLGKREGGLNMKLRLLAEGVGKRGREVGKERQG